jgi:cyclohexanone monooxygenase
LEYLRGKNVKHIEANEDAENDWVAHVGEVADATLYPRANSWYVGANIPGKPRVFTPYVAGLDKYRRICDDIATSDYRGFSLKSGSM